MIDKICAGCAMKFISGTHFVELAVKMYHSYSLKMALRGSKNVEKYSANKVVLII
jgi:hypothetical protein